MLDVSQALREMKRVVRPGGELIIVNHIGGMVEACTAARLPVAHPLPEKVEEAGGVIGYGPVLVFCTWASHRWGRRSLRADSGLFAKWADTGAARRRCAGHRRAVPSARYQQFQERAGDPAQADDHSQ